MRKGILAGLLTVAIGLTAAPGAVAAPAKPKPSDPKIIYLTFDDGPDWGNDPRLLQVLRRAKVPATFFVVGSIAAGNPKGLRGMYLGGHAVGNHTWSHGDLTRMSADGVAAELRRTQKVLGPRGGACMRPPYGAVNSTVMGQVARDGMRTVMWDVDPQDWAHQNSDYIVNHVLSRVRDRSTVLLHDGGGPRGASTTAVARLIPLLRARGYEFRTVPACRVTSGEVLAASRTKQKRRPLPLVAPAAPEPVSSVPVSRGQKPFPTPVTP